MFVFKSLLKIKSWFYHRYLFVTENEICGVFFYLNQLSMIDIKQISLQCFENRRKTLFIVYYVHYLSCPFYKYWYQNNRSQLLVHCFFFVFIFSNQMSSMSNVSLVLSVEHLCLIYNWYQRFCHLLCLSTLLGVYDRSDTIYWYIISSTCM